MTSPYPLGYLAALFTLGATACDMEGDGAATKVIGSVAVCTATGATLVSPPLTEAELCERFTAKLRKGLPANVVITVRLSFKPSGLAEAVVTRTRTGAAPVTTSHALAVSDRGFRSEDLDSLAREVLRAISAAHSQ